jgi:putative membrane-bound dehydrogenase-like protein
MTLPAVTRIAVLAAGTLLVVACARLIADEAATTAPVDVNQIQTPGKPAPERLRIVDQGDQDPRLKGYKLPQGVRVEIVAEEPTAVNPVGMTFGVDGTLYVLEWRAGDGGKEAPEDFKYKDGTHRTLLTMKKKVRDAVKVLRDSKGVGKYDASEVILEDDLPSSILLNDGWLYLTGRGTVRRYKQSRAAGPYDTKEIVAQGFCAFHHHQVSGLTIGNDGWLYVTSGDNDNYVEGSDGSRSTVLRTGAVFRMRPDGSQVQTYAIGFRNPYRDVSFDLAGNMFHGDNDNEDGSKFTGCRLMHIAEGNDFGWRLHLGAHCCVPDPVRGAVYGELPGKMPPLCKTGRGSPAGLLIYNDERFPENYRGLLLYPDVFRRLIRAYKVEKAGASFAITEEFEFMKSDDPLFRPCQMVTGPDGAIYVVDWRTDSGGAGRLSGDGVHGRIYRLSWSGTAEQPALPLRGLDSWAKVAKLDDAALVKALMGGYATDRTYAQQELRRRGDRNRPALLSLLQDGDAPPPARVAALGVLQSFWNDEVESEFIALLKGGDADLRRLAADGLGLNAPRKSARVHSALLKQLGDDDLAVRRSVALAMGHVAAPGAADSLANALAFDDSRDVYLRDGLVRALEALGAPGIEAMVALANSGDSKVIDKVVEAFAATRTRPAAEAIPGLLANPHLSIARRADLVRSCTNYLLDPPLSLEAVFAYLISHPEEAAAVKLAALEVLAAGGATESEKGASWLLATLDDNDAALRAAALKAGEAVRLAAAGPKLVRLLRLPEVSSADRQATLKALRAVKDTSSIEAIKDVLADAREETPTKAEALRTLAALDSASGVTAARWLLHATDPILQGEAVQMLGADVVDARLVGRLFLEKKLPGDLLPRIYDALRKHAERDPESATLLADVMKRGLSVANSPAEVARVRRLVATKGRPERGRAIYLNSKALACVTCHRMEGFGGSVGPDLTRLWDTQSIEKIMESILEPSKEIKEGYQSFIATTKKGQVFTGLKISQTADEVVLRDAGARDVHIATKDLEELVASKLSLMPENVVGQLSYDQFIDLVAFLKDRKAQESLRSIAKEAERTKK